MTRYEELIYKADLCTNAAINSTNEKMRNIWFSHAQKLNSMAKNSTLQEANTNKGEIENV